MTTAFEAIMSKLTTWRNVHFILAFKSEMWTDCLSDAIVQVLYNNMRWCTSWNNSFKQYTMTFSDLKRPKCTHTHRLPMSISSQSSGVQRSAHMSFLLTYLFLYPTYYSTVITCDDNKVTVYCTYYLWHCSASIHQRLLCYLGLYSFFSPQNQLQ